MEINEDWWFVYRVELLGLELTRLVLEKLIYCVLIPDVFLLKFPYLQLALRSQRKQNATDLYLFCILGVRITGKSSYYLMCKP